jgi:hypothetical protein
MKRILLSVTILLTISFGAFAYSGGGTFEGRFYPYPRLSNTSVPASISGGFGYGTGRAGSRTGGFGLIITDSYTEEFYGAFGGLISGQQLRLGPVTGSINAWTGVGYLSPRFGTDSGVAFYGELTGEVGVALISWMQASVYAGMNAVGTFEELLEFHRSTYSPVLGLRFTWGRF